MEQSGFTRAGPTGLSSIQFTVAIVMERSFPTPNLSAIHAQWSSSSRVSTAQIIRAFLLASATVAIFLLRRVINPFIHQLLRSTLFLHALMTALAP